MSPARYAKPYQRIPNWPMPQLSGNLNKNGSRVLIQAPDCVTVTLLFDSIDKTSIRKILFLRPGAVGDLLVSTAALDEVCRNFPHAEICVAGPSTWSQFLHPNVWPQITRLLVLEKNASQGNELFANKVLQNELNLSFPHSLWITSETVKKLTATPLKTAIANSDLFINLRLESLRYAWPGAQAKYHMGTSPWPCKFLFTHWSPWLGRDPIIHERDRLLEVLEAKPTSTLPLGLVSKNKFLLRKKQTGDGNLKPNPQLSRQPNQDPNSLAGQWRDRGLPHLLPSKLLSLSHRRRRVLINPTASRWEKAWPKEKFAALTTELRRRYTDLEIVVIGAPHETEWLKTAAGDHVPVLQPASFWELLQILADSRGLVTNASSMQFFANSAQTPVCTLLGRTYPARWGPLGKDDLTICGRMPIKSPRDVFEEDFLAFDSLSVDEVSKKVQPWLERVLQMT
jgi:ADP-heptose:LPS heptosyltransferase